LQSVQNLARLRRPIKEAANAGPLQQTFVQARGLGVVERDRRNAALVVLDAEPALDAVGRIAAAVDKNKRPRIYRLLVVQAAGHTGALQRLAQQLGEPVGGMTLVVGEDGDLLQMKRGAWAFYCHCCSVLWNFQWHRSTCQLSVLRDRQCDGRCPRPAGW